MIDDIISPGLSYKIGFSCYEVRMSHWIEQPHLIRIQDNQTLFSLTGNSWSAARVEWLDDATVQMMVFKYPGRISYMVRLHADADLGTVTNPFLSFSGTLSDVSAWILNR